MTRHEYCANGAILTAKRGSDLPHSKLDEYWVRQIRANQPNWTARQWADFLNLHYRTIEKVRHFASWRHVL